MRTGNKWHQGKWLTALREAQLSPTAVAVGAVLCSYANNETGMAYPKRETMAKALHVGKDGDRRPVSQDTIKRGLRELEKAGLIACVERGAKGRRPNKYRLMLPANGGAQVPPNPATDEARMVTPDQNGGAQVPPNPANGGAPVPHTTNSSLELTLGSDEMQLIRDQSKDASHFTSAKIAIGELFELDKMSDEAIAQGFSEWESRHAELLNPYRRWHQSVAHYRQEFEESYRHLWPYRFHPSEV